MALHLPIGSLKTQSGLEPVPRCEPSPLADDITTAPSGPMMNWYKAATLFKVLYCAPLKSVS